MDILARNGTAPKLLRMGVVHSQSTTPNMSAKALPKPEL